MMERCDFRIPGALAKPGRMGRTIGIMKSMVPLEHLPFSDESSDKCPLALAA